MKTDKHTQPTSIEMLTILNGLNDALYGVDIDTFHRFKILHISYHRYFQEYFPEYYRTSLPNVLFGGIHYALNLVIELSNAYKFIAVERINDSIENGTFEVLMQSLFRANNHQTRIELRKFFMSCKDYVATVNAGTVGKLISAKHESDFDMAIDFNQLENKNFYTAYISPNELVTNELLRINNIPNQTTETLEKISNEIYFLYLQNILNHSKFSKLITEYGSIKQNKQ